MTGDRLPRVRESRKCLKWTNLAIAAHYGRLDLVQAILGDVDIENIEDIEERRALSKCSHSPKSLDSYNGDGYTPLILAAKGGHVDICKVLVAKGANPNIPHQTTGETALSIAIEQGEVNLVKLLLSKGALVQTCDNVKSTPLYAAVRLGHYECVQLLLEHGADPNIGSQDHTPLFLTARLGHLKIAKELVKYGCDINQASAHGVTPVHEASIKGQLEMVNYLIEKGVDLNKTDRDGTSPLYSASKAGHLQICMSIAHADSDACHMDNRKRPLNVAIEEGQTAVAEFLFEKGFSLGSPAEYKPSIKKMICGNHSKMAAVLMSWCCDLDLSGCLDECCWEMDVGNFFWSNNHLLRMLILSGIPIPTSSRIREKTCANSQDLDCEDLQFLIHCKAHPLSLKEQCRISVRHAIGNHIVSRVRSIQLPATLKDYITLKIL